MPLPALFQSRRQPGDHPAAVAASRELVESRRVAAAQADNGVDAARAAYDAALADPEQTGVDRAHRDLQSAIAKQERARDALRVAEAQNVTAEQAERRKAHEAERAAIHKLSHARIEAAREFAKTAEAAALARKAFDKATADLWHKLPTRDRTTIERALPNIAESWTQSEMERVGLVAGRPAGFPAPVPIVDRCVALAALLRRGDA